MYFMYRFILPYTFNMQQKILFVFTQYVILCVLQGPALIKALVGTTVRSVHQNEFSAVVCLSKYAPQYPLTQTIYCTGTLISENHILTAEDCLTHLGNYALQVIVGTGNVANATCTYPIWWISYNNWANYVLVHVETQHNNIAIVKTVGILPPNIHVAVLSPFTPLNIIEGFHVDLFGCSPLNENINNNMVKTVRVGVLPKGVCNNIVSQLEGEQLSFPVNYICTLNIPYAQLQGNDIGSPVVYFNTIVAVSLRVAPPMGGAFDAHKVNAHIGIDFYRDFIHSILQD